MRDVRAKGAALSNVLPGWTDDNFAIVPRALLFPSRVMFVQIPLFPIPPLLRLRLHHPRVSLSRAVRSRRPRAVAAVPDLHRRVHHPVLASLDARRFFLPLTLRLAIPSRSRSRRHRSRPHRFASSSRRVPRARLALGDYPRVAVLLDRCPPSRSRDVANVVNAFTRRVVSFVSIPSSSRVVVASPLSTRAQRYDATRPGRVSSRFRARSRAPRRETRVTASRV